MKNQKSGCIILINRHGPLLLLVFSAFCSPLQAQALLADFCWAPWSGEDGHWGPRRTSKLMSWSQESKRELFLNKFTVKIFEYCQNVLMHLSHLMKNYWQVLFDIISLSCTVSCGPFSWWICHWSSIGNHTKMDLYLICFLLICKVYYCIVEQKLTLFDKNLQNFSQRQVSSKSLCAYK